MKYTPAIIVEKRLFFSIPIYQRLFEWDTENIVTLLEDLKKSFTNSPDEDYYIGMLTSTKDNELVDGQQRFTVMMLMGCIFQKYYSQWKDFLYSDNQRLYFASRPNDNAYMMSLIIDINNKDNQVFKNKKMQNGIDEIDKFIKESIDCEEERTYFASYIYNHLCFFISELPTGYNPRDLNKYFERMNTSGKNLEHHEILKVKLLSNLDSNISTYMLLWNKLSDVDTLLIRKHNDEDENSYSYRKQHALCSNIETILAENLINGFGAEKEEESYSIESIKPSDEIPKGERAYTESSHCALTFPYILLQTLYRMLDGKINCRIEDFFKPSNLLDIFSEYLPYEGPKVNVERINSFMENLVKSRLALDICFVRPTEFGYSLDMNTNEDDNDWQELLMLQSMLYVSSSNYTHYRWFGWLMDAVIQNNGIPNVRVLYKHLKTADEKEHNLPTYESLSYGEIRYWFWKLDLYIWLNRKNIFKEKPEALKVADNYVFRRNRSIEHIAPQKPLGNSYMIWEDTESDKEIMNSFGNLVMISQGLNSSLKNESFEIKKSHVQSYCNGSKIGSIESLKLLVVYQQYEKWTRPNIKEHGRLMYEWLKDSFEK